MDGGRTRTGGLAPVRVRSASRAGATSLRPLHARPSQSLCCNGRIGPRSPDHVTQPGLPVANGHKTSLSPGSSRPKWAERPRGGPRFSFGDAQRSSCTPASVTRVPPTFPRIAQTNAQTLRAYSCSNLSGTPRTAHFGEMVSPRRRGGLNVRVEGRLPRLPVGPLPTSRPRRARPAPICVPTASMTSLYPRVAHNYRNN